MDTPLNPSPLTVRVLDGYYRTAGKKTKQITLRIYEEDFVKLKNKYDGNMSLVARILMEHFIAGHLPEVDTLIAKQFADTTSVVTT